MPIVEENGQKIILCDYPDAYKSKYWKKMSQLICENYSTGLVVQPQKVTNILLEAFHHFCSFLTEELSKCNKASFYFFCHYLNENMNQIWMDIGNKNHSLSIDPNDFARTRRGLKIILEQATKLDLKGNISFYHEYLENQKIYQHKLEELLYIINWSVELSEYVAQSQILPGSLNLQIEKNLFTTLNQPPYPEFIKSLHLQMSDAGEQVELFDTYPQITSFFKKLNIDINQIMYDIPVGDPLNPSSYFKSFELQKYKEHITVNLGYNQRTTDIIFEGLTVSEDNVLDVSTSIYNNQHENRFTFRPILKYNIDNTPYYLVYSLKWYESIYALTTNCFPFGNYPKEWNNLESFTKLISELSNNHDKILENPILKFLEEKNIMHDNNVKTLHKNKQESTSLLIKGLGEIDIIFIHQKFKTIYICECKNNRARFDFNNWKRDISKFKNEYEIKLIKKVEWLKNNIELLQKHFELKYSKALDFSNYSIMPIFIINAPTLYMFDGKVRAFSIKQIKDIINEIPVDIHLQFKSENDDKEYIIKHPYFSNLEIELFKNT